MMKLSPFHTTSSVPDVDDKLIIYSFTTGDINILSKRVYNQLLQENFDLDPAILKYLTEAGIIVNSDIQTKADLHVGKKLTLILFTGNSCNLRCTYCGESKGTGSITNLVQDKIIRFVDQKLSKGQYDQLEVCWFGGEPTLQMKAIRRMSKILTRLSAKYSCAYMSRIVTNGVLLSESVFNILIDECKVYRIEITLDGHREWNDTRRKDIHHRGYYDHIINNVTKLCNLRNDVLISIRCNVDKTNVDGIVPLLEDIKAKGIADKIRFYIASIHEWGSEKGLLSMTTEEFGYLQIEILKYMFHNGFNLSSHDILPYSKNVNKCVAESQNVYIIDHEGQLYQCAEEPYTDHEEAIIGQIGQKLQYKDDMYSFTKEQLSRCLACPIYPVCAGGCMKRTRVNGQSDCDPLLYNMKLRLQFAYETFFKESIKKIV